MDLDELFDESLTVGSRRFLELISNVNQIFSSEEREAHIGDLKITGRLIHMPAQGEVIIIGDIHGDLSSLRRILSESKFLDKALSKSDIHLIFLGDYGDRGVYSPETYYVVLTLKNMFPKRVLLLQGNHEGPESLPVYPHDLPHHLNRKFGSDGPKVYDALSRLFRRFYTAVLVNGKYIMLHGGVPSNAKSLEDVAFAYRKHPVESHLKEILWSDPVDGIRGKYPSPRGAGYLFGEDITSDFLKMLDVKFLIRGHEPSENGYKFNHKGKVLTLFSRKGAPYYNTYAAYLTLNLSRNYNSASEIEERIRKF